jgi:curved DNA-binding protein CbpA
MSERDRNEYYTLLGVSPDATPSQVEAAYKAALKATEGAGLELDRKAVEQAFTVLGNPTARAAYDATRASGQQVAGRYSEDDTEPNTLSDRKPHVYNLIRDPKGYYRLLGVSMDATLQDISTAYAIRKNGFIGGPSLEQQVAVREAFEALADPVSRTRYDPAFLTSGSAPVVQATRRIYRTFEPPFHAGIGPDASRTRIPDALLRETQPSPNPKPQGCLGVVLLFLGVIVFWG